MVVRILIANSYQLENTKEIRYYFLGVISDMDKQNDNQKDGLTVDQKIDQKERLKLYESWLNQARKDLVRVERNVSFADWDEVIFHSQQALEKLAKAIFILLIDSFFPFTHRIEDLVHHIENKLLEPVGEDRYLFFAKISQYYILGRYLNESGQSAFFLDENMANKLLNQTKDLPQNNLIFFLFHVILGA
ncbi:MAG: HEPN domain-containing protein [Deltaproteobacteria bacterium]|jgi:HEPN domain-containing protein|nr:HEPN domain-containing protein [Deltaproteobacteria bacterium]